MYRLEEERERRRAIAPLLYYQPWAKHATLHDQPWTKRIRVLLGANKSGKTYWGVNHGLAHSYGYYYWKVKGLELDPATGDLPPREAIPPEFWVRRSDGLPISVPNVGMVVTGLARDRGIGQVIYPVVEEMLPPSVKKSLRFRCSKVAGGIPTQMTLPNGSQWIFASSDQDPLTFEGTKLHWAWVDEPVRPFVFNGLWRGVAVDMGPIWFTLTPLGAAAAWMHARFVRSAPANTACLKVKMRDNLALSLQAIEEFESNGEWTDAERSARLEGEFESLGNRVIHNWDRDVHVCPSRLLPRDWLHGQTVDPHHARPPFVVWWKMDPATRQRHYYREYPVADFSKMRSGGKPPTDLAIIFRSIEGNDVPTVRIADPRFGKMVGQVHGAESTSWAERMEKCGLYYDTRVPNTGSVETGEQVIVDLLRYDRNYPIGPTNCSKIIVHDCCTNLINSFESYGILPQRDATKGEREKRSEEFKDPIDCVRYTELYELPIDCEAIGQQFTDEQLQEENESW